MSTWSHWWLSELTQAVSLSVNPSSQKYSTLPKFGFVVCVAHPGSFSRGDHEVVIVASRACGGRSSVGREQPGAGRIALREPQGIVRTNGAVRLVSPVSFAAPSTGLGKTAAKWRAVRTAKPCGPGRRCYGQALANAAVASTGAMAGDFREREGGQKEFGSRESAA